MQEKKNIGRAGSSYEGVIICSSGGVPVNTR